MYDAAGAGGTYSLAWTTAGVGKIQLWKDQRKNALFQPIHYILGTDAQPVVWIEGTQQSAVLNDVSLTVTWTPDDHTIAPVSATYTLTVTPIVNSFTVTPAAGQNINFIDQGPSGLLGIRAGGIVGGRWTPGEVVKADIVDGPRLGMYFVQNITEAKNGANGSAAEIVYTKASGLANLNTVPDTTQVPTLTFPCLDSESISPTDYPDFTSSPTPTGVAIQADDSPAVWAPNNNDQVDILDYRLSFRIYLVAKYGDDSLYTVGYINWKANFWADTNVPKKGVSVIRVPKGVTADTDWTISNVDVAQASPPTYNLGMTIK